MGQLCSKGASTVDTKAQLYAPEDQDVGDQPLVCKPASAQQLVRHKSGDSACSLHGRSFARWAEQECRERGMAMDKFLLDALCTVTVTDAAAEGSTNGDTEQAVQQQGTQAMAKPKMVTAPYQPHSAYEKGPPLPACGPERMATTTAMNELRVTQDDEVESVLRLLCNVFDVETAGVTLLTGECVWAPYVCGIMSAGLRPARWGFCGWAFLNANHELLVVEDSSKDARLSANLYVVDPAFSLIFYVAAPLISSNGHRLGTLCLFGQQPRKFDATRAQLLANMAELLTRQFERNWAMKMQEQREGSQLRRSLAVYDSACLVVDLSGAPWSILHMNPPAIHQLGVDWEPSTEYLAHHPAGRTTRKPWHGVPFDSVFEYYDKSPEWVSGSWEFVLRGVRGAASAPQLQDKLFDLHFRLATSDGLDQDQPFHVGMPSWLPMASDDFGRTYFFVRVQEAAPPGAAGTGPPTEALIKGGSGNYSVRSSTGTRLSSTCSSSAGNGGRLLGSGGSREVDASVNDSSSGGNSCVSSAWLPRGPQGALACPIEGLVLGPLVGKGSYGRVYRGIYRGAPVAVKIISDIKSMRFDKRGQPLEAALTDGMGHMGVMRTLHWAYGRANTKARRSSGGSMESSRPPSASGSTGGGSRSRSEGGACMSEDGISSSVGVRFKSEGGACISEGDGKSSEDGASSYAVGSVRFKSDGGGRDSGDISNMRPRSENGAGSGVVRAVRFKSEGGGSGSGSVASGVRFQSEGGGHGSSGRNSSGDRPRRKSEGGSSSASSKTCWMVMEYCDLGCIADAVVRGCFRTSRNPTEGGTNLRTVAVTAYEIASAMQYLHSHGVVHGDLCGGNVMLKASDVYKHGFLARVGDFGLAREASAGPGSIKKNMYGTVTHMPPEVLMDGGVSKATDVYSFGVLLWEMLTGTWAWAGLRHTQIICQVALLKRSLAIPAGLPEPLEKLLRSCLAQNPADRPSFDEAVAVLNDWLQATWREDEGAMTMVLTAAIADAA